MSNWTLFSNHGHVLVSLSRHPEARLRDVAADVGITERAVQKIVRDLQDAGMLGVTKNGRRNSYRIHHKSPLRHELEADCTLKDLLKVINKASRQQKRSFKPQKINQQAVSHQDVSPVVNVKPATGNQDMESPPRAVVKETGEPKKRSSKKNKETSKPAIKKEKQQGTLF